MTIYPMGRNTEPTQLTELFYGQQVRYAFNGFQIVVYTNAPLNLAKIKSPSYVIKDDGLVYFFFESAEPIRPTLDKTCIYVDDNGYRYHLLVKGNFYFVPTENIIPHLPQFKLSDYKLTYDLSNAANEASVAEDLVKRERFIAFNETMIYFFDKTKNVWRLFDPISAQKMILSYYPNASKAEVEQTCYSLWGKITEYRDYQSIRPELVLFNNNIIYDTFTGKAMPYDPDKYFMIRKIDVPYVDNETLSKIQPNETMSHSLETILCRSRSESDQKVFKVRLYELLSHIGFLMTSIKNNTIFNLIGFGKNGKSVFMDFLMKLIPDSSKVELNKFLTDDNYLSSLASQRLLYVDDWNDTNNATLNHQLVEKLKELSGAGLVEFRQMYTQNRVKTQSFFSFVTSVNNLIPEVASTTTVANVRRYKFLNIRLSIDTSRPLKSTVENELNTEENRIYIANHAVRAFHHFSKNVNVNKDIFVSDKIDVVRKYNEHIDKVMKILEDNRIIVKDGFDYKLDYFVNSETVDEFLERVEQFDTRKLLSVKDALPSHDQERAMFFSILNEELLTFPNNFISFESVGGVYKLKPRKTQGYDFRDPKVREELDKKKFGDFYDIAEKLDYEDLESITDLDMLKSIVNTMINLKKLNEHQIEEIKKRIHEEEIIRRLEIEDSINNDSLNSIQDNYIDDADEYEMMRQLEAFEEEYNDE